jgi:cytochrome o ubiquinol oxidase subunit II
MTKRKKNHNKSVWIALLSLAGFGLFVLVIVLLTRGNDIALLNPKGSIADEQFRLLITSTAVMLAFAAAVLFFIYFFAWKYRETNQKTVHDPRAGRSKLLILLAWAAPISIFVILTAIMLPATQELEPQRSIESDKKQLTIRVIAMRWKWIFMYPDQDIATVNFVQVPVDTPVRFELTADEAPMNGFWIPHLGGMLYAMTEHVNPLNLMAHTTGNYDGGASEVNGHGFAGMRFVARVSSQEDFDTWAKETAQSSNELGAAEYAKLLKPSENNPSAIYYSPTNRELFDVILKKYAGSHDHYHGSEHTEDGEH